MMYAKLRISGTIEVVTGLHVGGSNAFSAIGSVDSPVIRDPLTADPILPGSTLKGKMRTLLAREYNATVVDVPDQDDPRITSLFGCAKGERASVSKVIFSDVAMSNWAELERRGALSKTEVKFENTINRATAVANPRQIERVIRGARFPLDMVYEVSPHYVDGDGKWQARPDQELIDATLSDLRLLAEGLRLIEFDYLGGHGTRGYGKVRFSGIAVSCVVGEFPKEALEECGQVFSGFGAAGKD